MTGFDLILRLFGLLPNLAIAEVPRGFSATLRLRANVTNINAATIRVGWLAPPLVVPMVAKGKRKALALLLLANAAPLIEAGTLSR